MTTSKRSGVNATWAALAVAGALAFGSGQIQAAATIVINNINAAGVGFNDPTAATPVGGNSGTTLGEQRLIAFQYAANLWGASLTSNQPIIINAQFSASLAPPPAGCWAVPVPPRPFEISPMPRKPTRCIRTRWPTSWRARIWAL